MLQRDEDEAEIIKKKILIFKTGLTEVYIYLYFFNRRDEIRHKSSIEIYAPYITKAI
jgi:hypothetical protein